MNRLILIFSFLLVGALSGPADALAQFPFPGRPGSEDSDRRGREDRDRDDDDDRWDVYDDDRRGADRSSDRGNGERRGPPFCRNGEGHPVHGMEWCRDRGFGGYSVGDIIFGSDRDGRDRGRYSSYDREHADFHRALDARYMELAARRPLDVQYQLELRRAKQEEHDRWHRRAGVAHR